MSAPGVLLIIADDWSPLAQCYGNAVVQTPRTDALAREATVFNRAYCTSPSCAASRANILTGLYSHQHGQYGHSHGIHHFRTHDTVRTLPAVLNDSGAFTGLVGKDHVAPLSAYPFQYLHNRQARDTAKLASAAREFYAQAKDKPFFLHAASLYPHRTGGDFDPATGEGPAGDVTYRAEDVIVPDFLPDVPEVRADLAQYYTFVSRYDAFVGAMLDELERSGRARDTLVLVLSDHGMPFPGAKASSYNTGHHCPLIMRDPRRGVGKTDALVNWTDLAPTIADFLGVNEKSRPEKWTGQSLLPLTANPAAAGFDLTFFSHSFHEITNYYPYRAAMDPRYKYVRHLAWQQPLPLASDLFSSPSWQVVKRDNLPMMGKRKTQDVLYHPREALYDIEADPMETRNLLDDPARQADVGRLRRALTELRIKTRDPWLEIDYQEGTLPQRLGPA